MKKIRLIGDIHNQFEQYYNIIKNIKYSIQLGDFGDTSWKMIEFLNSKNHKIIAGNHDNYSICQNSPFYLGEYGNINFHGFNFFFVRGAWSIDWKRRIPMISWWDNEQLSYHMLVDAMNEYIKVKPDIILTHECPVVGIEHIFKKQYNNNDITSITLNQMFEFHKPKIWFYGHWHESRIDNILGTTFICINEFDYIDYDIEKNIDWNIHQIKKHWSEK